MGPCSPLIPLSPCSPFSPGKPVKPIEPGSPFDANSPLPGSPFFAHHIDSMCRIVDKNRQREINVNFTICSMKSMQILWILPIKWSSKLENIRNIYANQHLPIPEYKSTIQIVQMQRNENNLEYGSSIKCRVPFKPLSPWLPVVPGGPASPGTLQKSTDHDNSVMNKYLFYIYYVGVCIEVNSVQSTCIPLTHFAA